MFVNNLHNCSCNAMFGCFICFKLQKHCSLKPIFMEAAHHHRSAATQRVDGDHDQSNKELSNKPEQPLQQRQGQHVEEQQHVPTQDCQLKQYHQPQCAMKSRRLSAKSNCNLGILQSNVGWIDDGIINSAQRMLKQRFLEKTVSRTPFRRSSCSLQWLGKIQFKFITLAITG